LCFDLEERASGKFEEVGVLFLRTMAPPLRDVRRHGNYSPSELRGEFVLLRGREGLGERIYLLDERHASLPDLKVAIAFDRISFGHGRIAHVESMTKFDYFEI